MAQITIKRVLFISRDRAEGMTPPAGTALISITDIGRRPANLKSGWHGILRVAFDDLDPDTFPIDFEMDYDAEDMEPMTREQAQEIANFVRDRATVSQRIIVHCRYGVSRSAGVAKAISEYVGIGFPSDYDEHNVYVYRMMKEAFASL